jgi:hypothetical protein
MQLHPWGADFVIQGCRIFTPDSIQGCSFFTPEFLRLALPAALGCTRVEHVECAVRRQLVDRNSKVELRVELASGRDVA